jgi:IS4 transposase
MLTLPITVASNERSFSKLKLIKNYLRSTMSNDRLFYLIISSVECDLLDAIDIQKLVNDWTKMKDRKICV